MSKTKTDPQEETRKTTLRGLFDKMLSTLETEIEKLPDTRETPGHPGGSISGEKTGLYLQESPSPPPVPGVRARKLLEYRLGRLGLKSTSLP